MSIPKKLDVINRDDHAERFLHAAGIEDTFEIRSKINELIGYLQANKPVGCCCIKKHSTGEVSKKDKYLCYTCNQWGIVGEHECEASKGERENIECLKKKVKKNIIDHSHAIYEELDPPESKGECTCSYYDWDRGVPNKKCLVHNPPEHEEIPHGYKLRHEDCEDCIKVTGDAWKPNMSEYVSKEKIKNSGVSIIRGFYLKGRNDEINKIVPDLEKLTGEIEHQLKKVGLGD